MALRLAIFVFVAVVLRYLFDGVLRIPFGRDAVSESWLIPYLHMAGPDLLFFFLAGLLLPTISRKIGVLRAAIISGAAFVAIYAAFLVFFSSFSAADWRGYLVLTAPVFGVFVGLALGVAASSWITLLASRRASPAP